jgi:hypothetical protein
MGQYENVVGPGLAFKPNFSHAWNEVQEYSLAVLYGLFKVDVQMIVNSMYIWSRGE